MGSILRVFRFITCFRTTDGDDSDVEIVSVSVKRPKQEGILSFLRNPMSKMSEWVRKKTVRQDHFLVRPVPEGSRWSSDNSVTEQQHRQHRQHNATTSISTTNGIFPYHSTQATVPLSRPSIHSGNGTSENGVNGDMHVIDKQPSVCQLSVPSSRRSSCSSSRPGVGRRSTVEQCFQLKERENYLKLLQQCTTVDLGYHPNRARVSHSQGAAVSERQLQKKVGSLLPLPTSSSSSVNSSLNIKSDSHHSAPRFRVTPSRFVQSASLPSDKVVDRPTSSSSASSTDSFVIPHPPRRSLHLHSPQPLSRRTQWQSSRSEKEQQNSVTPSSEEEIVIIEDEKPSPKKHSAPSLQFTTSKYLDDDWLSNWNSKHFAAEKERQQLIKEAEMKKKLLEERREARLNNLDKKLRQQMRLFDEEPEVIEELPLPEVPQVKPLPVLTDTMQREISAALDGGPSSQVLSAGFRLQLTRADIATLRGLNWLNDEVINFYMNMLMERGEQDGYSKAYAFNTFFYPKLMEGGHAAVKRWTRKVDLFTHQYLIIPVHLGVHWCLCVVFMKEKKICYYDSMGGNNNQCLNAIRQYLYSESMQKRNVELNLSEWAVETVKEIPQQMNGSDCGMFACMYAESITREADITFTQKDMPYFRRRMVYEILKKKLL